MLVFFASTWEPPKRYTGSSQRAGHRMDWTALPGDVASSHVLAHLGDRHRLLLSTASRWDRARWQHDESIRLSAQPAPLALLPLNQRRTASQRNSRYL